MIAPDMHGDIAQVAARYAIAISPSMAVLIDTSNPHDPIARQFVPSVAELITTPNELTDPIGDEAHSPVKGIVHRYPDRVLLKLLHTCPVYCRFCFRREVVGPQGAGSLTLDQQEAAFNYIASNPQIWEVILTGGDPLMLSARRIQEVMTKLGSIAHVKVIRWHSRVPIVTPERVTQAMAAALKLPNKATYIAIHANHPREFTLAACQGVRHLRDAGIILVSQSVLLKGINNDADTLEKLMRAFVENGIKPYYLHHPDLAKGTSHFRVSIGEGQALMQVLQGRLSGLCQPTYVLDIPGGFGKAPIGAGYAKQNTDGSWQVRDYNGGHHIIKC
jgi:lysine 2,3-aminomutase